MTAVLPPPINFQGFTQNGSLNAFGFVATYAAGSTTPIATYTDATQATPNPNPVPLNAIGQAAIWLSPGTGYKFVETDQFGNQCGFADQINASGAGVTSNLVPAANNVFSIGSPTFQWSTGYFGTSVITPQVIINGVPAVTYPQTLAEIAAGVVPTNFGFAPYTPQRLGVIANGVTDDTAAWVENILVAAQTVNGATGATVDATKLTGLTNVSSQIILPNRVRIKGPNASGLIFTATASHPGPYMFYANNGVTAMFDSILEDLYIDCGTVASLSAIRTDAWQENSGMRSVGIKNCTTYGVHFFNVGAGGQSTCELEQVQIFCSAAGATAAITVDQISSVGAFELHVRDSVIAGGGAGVFARGIDMQNDSLLLENCHFENCTDCVYTNGAGHITLINCSGGPSTTNLVHLGSSFTGTLSMIGCQRNGATLLVQNDVTGEQIGPPDQDYSYPGAYSELTVKAWCLFNGTTAGTNPPTSGYNVTSVTRNSVGNYSINLLRPMNSVNSMCPMASSNLITSGTSIATQLSSAGKFNVLIDVAGTPTDSGEVKAVCFGI